DDLVTGVQTCALPIWAIGMTVAKAGEAAVMAEICDDILMAYPAVDAFRAGQLAKLAGKKTIRVGIDSALAAEVLGEAARAEGSKIGRWSCRERAGTW